MKHQLPPHIYAMLKKALRVRNSRFPFYKVLDILATDDGDVSTVARVFDDMNERELREAFHNCAQFLRAAEDYLTGGQQRATTPQKVPAQIVEDQERLKQAKHVKIYIDGCSKGNPGPAGIGIVVSTIDGETLLALGRFIGEATNNLAEYAALKEALIKAREYNIPKLDCFTDSELLANQVSGKFKVKSPALARIYKDVMDLKKSFALCRISYLAREHNRGADRLASRAVRDATKSPIETETPT